MLSRTLLFMVAAMGLLAGSVPAMAAGQKLKVVATIFPVYDFARVIGGDKADVSLLLPPGVEAHAFEPRPQDIVRLNRADVFLYTGDAMEPWAADMAAGLTNKALLIVDTSRGVVLTDGDLAAGEHPPREAAVDGGHPHGGADPHVWLDPALAAAMVDTIAGAFAEKDEANRAYYLAKAKAYKARLHALDARYAAALSSCEVRTIIYAGHFAFGYLARRYRLSHVSPYRGFSPNAEPAPRSIKEIIDTINRVGSRVVYYEELIDPRVARMISGETGVRLMLLHGAHNVSRDELGSATYLGIMESNLVKLREGLRCP